MGVLTTIPKSGNKGMGGLSHVMVAEYSTINAVVDQSTGYCTFTNKTVDPSIAFTKFVMTKETSNWTETATGSAPQASTFYNQVLTLVFGKNDTVKRNNIKALGNTELMVVAVDRNGIAQVLGSDTGLDMTSSIQASGTAPGDLNGSTIVLTGNSAYPAPFCSSTQLAIIGG